MSSRRNAGCIGGALLLVVVVGLLASAFRGDLLRRWRGEVVYSEVSLEAAQAGEAKLERLLNQGDTVRLTAVEVASLLRYRFQGQYHEYLQNPTVAMSGDTLRLGARVPTDRLPDLAELARVRAFLPDTTSLELAGTILPREAGRAAIELGEVAVVGIPIPRRYYPDLLDRAGRRDEPGLPPEAIAFRLPDGIGSARVENGELVLTP